MRLSEYLFLTILPANFASYGAIRGSLIPQLVKNLPALQETPVSILRWRNNRLPTPVFLGFPCGSAGKESPWNVGDLGSIPGLERPPRKGKGYSLQYSGLEFYGLYSPCIVSDTTEGFSLSLFFHFHGVIIVVFNVAFFVFPLFSQH